MTENPYKDLFDLQNQTIDGLLDSLEALMARMESLEQLVDQLTTITARLTHYMHQDLQNRARPDETVQ